MTFSPRIPEEAEDQSRIIPRHYPVSDTSTAIARVSRLPVVDYGEQMTGREAAAGLQGQL